MLLKVDVNYPKDMSSLENKLSETLAKIFMKRLPEKEINELVEVLEDEKNNLQL